MNLEALKLDVRFLTNATSDDFSEVDLLRSLNRHYDLFTTFIWNNQGEWRFDDSNHDTFAVADTDLVVNQRDYFLPTDARQLHRVEVKNKGGDYIKLKRLHEADMGLSLSEFAKETGTPLRFAVRGRSLILYPAPSTDGVELAQGLRIYVSRSVTEMENNTDEPGFDREFHRVLSLGASVDWCISSENFRKKQELEQEMNKLMESARQHFANRDKTNPNRIRPKKENYA